MNCGRSARRGRLVVDWPTPPLSPQAAAFPSLHLPPVRAASWHDLPLEAAPVVARLSLAPDDALHHRRPHVRMEHGGERRPGRAAARDEHGNPLRGGIERAAPDND